MLPVKKPSLLWWFFVWTANVILRKQPVQVDGRAEKPTSDHSTDPVRPKPESRCRPSAVYWPRTETWRCRSCTR
jgi:hypothetical protein